MARDARKGPERAYAVRQDSPPPPPLTGTSLPAAPPHSLPPSAIRSLPRRPVRALAVSRDGRWVYSGSDDLTIRVWRATDGACTAVYRGHEMAVWSLALPRTGEVIFSGACGCCAGHPLVPRSPFLLHSAPLRTSARTGSEDHTIRSWNTEDGECLGIFSGARCASPSLPDSQGAPSPTTRKTATNAERSDRAAWPPLGGSSLPSAPGHTGAVRALVISRDGLRLFSASEDKTIRCWDALRGDCVQARSAKRAHFLPMCTGVSRDHWVCAHLLGPVGSSLRVPEL